MNRNSWIALLLGLCVACACVCLLAGGVGSVFAINSLNRQARRPTPAPVATARPPATSVPIPTPPARGTAAPASPSPNITPRTTVTASTRVATPAPVVNPVDTGTLAALLAAQTQLPAEDPTDLALRFKGAKPDQVQVVCNGAAPNYDIGATRPFTVSNQDSNTQFSITGELRYKTNNVYMWVERAPERLRIDDNRLRTAADAFQQKIYPTTRAFFGEEASPGVDCDPRIYILHAAGIGRTVGGYFSSPDAYPRAVRADSNEAEMFVIHADRGYGGANPGTSDYLSTLAHEFQHMISHNVTRAPALWLEEGAAQLSERLNGYAGGVGTPFDFAADPSTQLNTWSESSAGENSAHYGAGYLFWSYLYDRFGPDTVKTLVRAKERSIPSLINTMRDIGIVNPDTGKPYSFEELFADFVIANYQGRTKLSEDGGTPNRFNYVSTDAPPMTLFERLSAGSYPAERTETLNQFGTHYWELRGDKPQLLEFGGSRTAQLLPMTDGHGKFWYSNRGDVSNVRLTREFDLTNAKAPKLNYRTWYRTEKDYDYAYLTASTDGGKTWKTVKTPSCTTEDPNGANLGCGYTGPSGGDKNQPRWVNESVDLSEYAGKKVMLRFETVTDAGVNREGMAIDDIEIPEIGFKDDAEKNNGWTAEGWIVADNILPQSWHVQLITESNDGKAVARQVLLDGGKGAAQLNFGSAPDALRRVVVAVSPTTLVTTEPATYQLKVR